MKHFRPFRFDEASGTLWRARQPAALTRKAADLLRLFLDRAGVPLSHQEIKESVWPDTHVQTQNIKTLVHELRSVLGDDVQQPMFIRADPGRGYTFLADATDAPVPLCDPDCDPGKDGAPPLVGRRRELALVQRLFTAAATGAERQVVLIEGERGSGKTLLCRAVAEHARQHGSRVSFAQALELKGPVEPYAVLADALDLLARQYPAPVAAAIQRNGPGWHHRIAGCDFVAPDTADRANGHSQLLWELVRVVDDLTQDVPLVLILDDLQWSDPQTIEWIGAMARRRVSSRLLICATFCASEGEISPNVPVLDRLGRHLNFERCGHTIRLDKLSDQDVADDLTRRFGDGVANALTEPLARATGGNARLMVDALDALVNVGLLRSTESGWCLVSPTDGFDPILASSLVGGFEWQADRLTDDDRSMLVAAAIVGARFTAPAVAAVLESASADDINRRLLRLARRHVLVRTVAHADDSASGSFMFLHPIAADVLLSHAAVQERMRLARRVVDREALTQVTRARRRAAT